MSIFDDITDYVADSIHKFWTPPQAADATDAQEQAYADQIPPGDHLQTSDGPDDPFTDANQHTKSTGLPDGTVEGPFDTGTDRGPFDIHTVGNPSGTFDPFHLDIASTPGPQDGASPAGPVGGFYMPTSTEEAPIGPQYGDGPDLDHNGVPDEIGINPDNMQPGYPQGEPPIAQNPSTEPPLLPSSSATDPNTHLTQSKPFDSTSSGSTLHPDLLNPIAPGPTLDHGLVDQIQQNPHLVNALNQNPDLASALEQDPSSLDQVTHYMGLTPQYQSPVVPSDVTDPSTTSGHDFYDPSLTDPGHTDPSLVDSQIDYGNSGNSDDPYGHLDVH